MPKFIKIIVGAILVVTVLYISGRWAYSQLFFTDTLITGAVGRPRYINPLLAQSDIDQILTAAVYRGLINYNENFEPIGDLAESWNVDENSKTYTIKLKTGQHWHDDKLITAADVVFTFSLMKDLDAVTVEAVDDSTVKFTLPEPLSSFVEVLSRGILPQHIWEGEDLRTSEYNLKPIGSGPYQYESIQISDGKVKSLKFRFNSTVKQDHAIASPRLTKAYPKVRYVFYKSSQSLIDAYKLGEIDGFETIDAEIANPLKPWPNTAVTEITNYELPVTNYAIFFNLRNENGAVANVETRRALAHKLIDANVQLTGPLPQNHWAYAQHNIPDASVDVSGVSLRILYLDIPTLPTLLTQLTGAWTGTTLETAPTQFPPTGEWDVLIVPLELPKDPDQYVYWHSSQTDFEGGGLNISNYKNRRVNKALEDGRKTADREARKAAYEIWQRWLAQDVPAVFVETSMVYNIKREER